MVTLERWVVSWKNKDICDRKLYTTKKGAMILRKKFINIFGKKHKGKYKVKKIYFDI